MMLLLLLLFVCSARRGHGNQGSNNHHRPEERPSHSRPEGRPSHADHSRPEGRPRPGSNQGGHGNRPNGIGGPNDGENWGFRETLIAERSTTTPAPESTEFSLQDDMAGEIVTLSVGMEEYEHLNTSPPTNSLPRHSGTSTVYTTQYTNDIDTYTETLNTAHLFQTEEESETKSKYTDLHITAIALGSIAVTMCLVSILVISCCEVDSSNIDLDGPVKELHLDQEGAKTDIAEIDVKMQNLMILDINEEGAVELKA